MERYFSCISDTLKGEEDKGGVGEKTPSRCVSPREGLEPCHSRLSLHQLSLIAREDSRPRARSLLILFSAFRRVKGELLLLIFSLIRFFFSVIPTILSSGVTPAPFTACPCLHLPTIMTKAQALLNRGGEGRSALGEGEGGLCWGGGGGALNSSKSGGGGVHPFPNLLRSLSVFPQIHPRKFSWLWLGERPFFNRARTRRLVLSQRHCYNKTPGCLRQWGLCDLSARLGMRRCLACQSHGRVEPVVIVDS